MKNKIKSLFIGVALIIIMVVLLVFLMQSYGNTALGIFILVGFVFEILLIGYGIYTYTKATSGAKANRANMAEIMSETLNTAAGEKAGELRGQVLAVITRLNNVKNSNTSCFAAVTNDELIISLLTLSYAPIGEPLRIPFAEVTKCTVKPMIIRGRYTVKLCYGENICSLILYSKLPYFSALVNQEINNEVLLEELEKRTNYSSLMGQ